MVFNDRTHAGEMLAKRLLKYKAKDCYILALTRGGVPVAAEVASRLGMPMNVLIVRKIGAPFNSEYAVGAICEDAEPIFNEYALSRIGIEPDNLNAVVSSQIKEINRQVRLYRGGQRLPSLVGKTVLLIDDGMATGTTMHAAVKYLKRKSVGELVVAVPVAPVSSAKILRQKVEGLVVLEECEDLNSVGEWYFDFSQVNDEEVMGHLNDQLLAASDSPATMTPTWKSP